MKRKVIIFLLLALVSYCYEVQKFGDFNMTPLPSDMCNWSQSSTCKQQSLISTQLSNNMVKALTVYGNFIPLSDSDTSTLFQIYDQSISKLRLEFRIQPLLCQVYFKIVQDADDSLLLQSIPYIVNKFDCQDANSETKILQFAISLSYQDAQEGIINIYLKGGSIDFYQQVTFPFPSSKIFQKTSIIQVCENKLYGSLSKLKIAYNYDIAYKIDSQSQHLISLNLSYLQSSLSNPQAPTVYKMDYYHNLKNFYFFDITKQKKGKFLIDINDYHIPVQKLSSIQLTYPSGFSLPLDQSEITSSPLEFGVTMNVRKFNWTDLNFNLIMSVEFNEGFYQEINFLLPDLQNMEDSNNQESDTFTIGMFLRFDFDQDILQISSFSDYNESFEEIKISSNIDFYYTNYEIFTIKSIQIRKVLLQNDHDLWINNPLELLDVRVYKNIFGFERQINSQETKLANCDIATGIKNKKCLRCSRGYLLNNNGICQNICDTGYYQLGRDCIKVCAYGNTGGVCTIPGNCSYLQNSFNPSCDSGDYNCRAKYGDQCFLCQSVQYQSRCISSQDAFDMNLFYPYTEIAFDVPEGAKLGEGLICAFGYFYQEGECVKECSLGFKIQNQNWCVRCRNLSYHQKKSICADGEVTNCLLYQPGSYSNCILCKQGFELTNSQCEQSRIIIIDNCREYSSDDGSCVKCNDGYFLQKNRQVVGFRVMRRLISLAPDPPNICVKQCSPSFYLDYSNLQCKNSLSTTESESCEKRDGYRCLKCAAGYNLSCGQCVLCTQNGVECPTVILPINGKTNNDNTQTTCRDDFILFNGNCYQNCPDGYYQDSQNTCQQCDITCLTCTTTSTQCVIFKENGGCTSGYYPKNQGCYPCSPECDKCTGPNNGQCTVCKSGFVLNGTSCEYKTSCTSSNEYMTQKYECKPCSQNCSTCVFQDNQCTSCPAGQFIMEMDFSCNTNCPISKPDPTYCSRIDSTCDDYDYSLNVCKTCISSLIKDSNGECSTFCLRDKPIVDEVNNQCVIQCPLNTFLDSSNTQLKCVDTCPINTIQDPNSQMCCQQSCKTCLQGQSDKCILCNNDLVQQNNQCVTSCNDNFRNNNGICEACQDQNCKECLDSVSTCTICMNSYYLKEGICTTDCGDGYYLDGLECKKCIADCVTCTNGVDCTLCKANYFFNSFQCIQCSVPNCEICKTDQQCKTCNNGYDLLNTSFSCVPACNSNQYRDQSNQACTDCIQSCQSCIDGQSCKSCITGYEFVSVTLKCEKKCLSSEYRDSSGVCQPCISNCSQCTNSTSCIKCINGFEYVSQLNLCDTLCLSNYFRDSTGVCQPCVSNCSQCSNNTSCTQCNNGYEYVPQLNLCDSLCEANNFRDQSGQCTPCQLANCKTCTSLTQCQVCIDNFTLDSNNHCILASCPDGQFIDATAGYICQACSQGCKKCINNQQCIQCYSSDDPANNFYLTPQPQVKYLRNLAASLSITQNAWCSTQCPSTMRPDLSNNICCHPTCQNCNGFEANQCLSCPAKYALQPINNKCQITCNSGEYVKDPVPAFPSARRNLLNADNLIQSCQQCLTECETCENGESCLTCKAGYYFENGKCVTQCTTGLYKLDAIQGKICCDTSCESCFNSLKVGCITCSNEVYSVNSSSKTCEYDKIKADKLSLINNPENSLKNSQLPQEYCHWSCKKCKSFEYDQCEQCVSPDRIFYRGTCSCPPSTEDLGSECIPSERQGNEAFITLNYIVLVSFFGFVLAGKYPLFSINTLFISQFAGYFIYFQEPGNVYNKDYIYKAFNIDNLASFFPNPFTSSYLTYVDARYDQQYVELEDQIPNDFRYILNEKSQNFLFNVFPLLMLFSFFGILYLIVRFVKDPRTQSQSRMSSLFGGILQSLRVSLQWNVILLIMIFSYQEVITFIALQFQKISTSNAINVFGMLFSFVGVAYAIYVPGIIYYGINHANFDKNTKYGVLIMNCINETSFTGKNQVLIMLVFKIIYAAIFVSDAKDKGSAILLLLLIYGLYRIFEIALNYRTTQRSKIFLLLNLVISILIFILAAHAYSLSKYKDANLKKFYDYDFAQDQIRAILVFIFSMKVLIMIAEMVALVFFYNRIQAIYSKDASTYSPSQNKKSSAQLERKQSKQPLTKSNPPNISDDTLNDLTKIIAQPLQQSKLNPFLISSPLVQSSLELTQSPLPQLQDIKSTQLI